MELYAHQKYFVETAPDLWGMFHGTGTGKTVTAIAIAKNRVDHMTLIVCPKGVKSKWERETKGINGFYIYTKEEFRKKWKEINPVEAIIIDEAHHFSSTKSQLHKNMLAFIKKQRPKHIWLLTATPYRREPMNIYALAKILGHNWNYITFRHKFYYEQYFGPYRTVWLPKKGMHKEVAKLVQSIGDVVSFEECGDLPAIQHEIKNFDMTVEQKKAMVDLEMTEANPLTYYMREHQICSGVKEHDIVKTNKEDYIIDLAETVNKLAIFCRYTLQIDTLKTLLSNEGYKVFTIDGRTVDKDKVAQEVEASEKCIVIIQMDSAEGFELPSVSTAVFASMSYSYLAYEQSLGRFIRINKANTPKLFIYLLTSKSIDEEVYKNLMNKQDFSLEIYAKSRAKV